LFLALTLVPLVLSFVPGLPVHGFGHIWIALPLLFWFRNPEQRKRLSLFVLGLGLQVLAYPEPDLGFLGWVLLLPYLFAREESDGASWWRAAFLYGFLRAHVGFYWLGNIHFVAWLTVSFFCGILFTVGFEGVLRWGRPIPFALRAAMGWILYEWLHSWLFGGLPWLFLSHSQYANPVVIQAADLVGASGLSFLLAYVQAAAFRARTARREIAVAALLLAATVTYGFARQTRKEPAAADQPEILMVQSAIPHSVKERGLISEDLLRDSLLRLTREGLEKHPGVRLVVWPETMFSEAFVEDDEFDRARFRWSANALAREFARPAIYGVNSYTSWEKVERMRGHNSAVLVDERGAIRGIYRKQRLVPMGEEFLPGRILSDETTDALFKKLYRGMGYPGGSNLESGEGHVTLDAGPGLRCAILICFEGLYPSSARGAMSEGDPDLLLHLVNNGWFGESWEERQSVASWVLRAVENRTPFFSCANGGITCAIAPSGRILGTAIRLEDGQYREAEVMEDGWLAARVPPRWPEPLYLRGGQWILPGGLLLAAAMVLLMRRLGRPKPGHRAPGP
jgi:apolipoprotein N-acyltransferase